MKGRFKPRRPEKYRGNVLDVVYRSSWELKLMTYLDEHDEVVEWGSETLAIAYRSPIDGKVHRYYPDFKIGKQSPDGSRQTLVVEVKPSRQCVAPSAPKKGTKPSKKFLTELRTYGVNGAKWDAARKYCADRKWQFIIMTERELFG